MRILAGLIIVFGVFASHAAFADDPADDAAFDAQFQCPETISDRDARIDELQRYQDWARDHHPDWTLRKRLDVRYGLLRRHACAVTLANVAASAQPPFGR
jgi:hypothetical protein